ncbi:disease resistance protein (TIR-NBS-LRR class), putative [Medicago truncatula]|uniref:Disease resistance protein (TIR-NBS-LRR class), putative n=1 Tax=Medicago truncatula TaxID=3880 RepID=G7KL60_MEDTR|nr:disease resistance protein (TIR-NBS-LRR class), putative [Medicago truncatula]
MAPLTVTNQFKYDVFLSFRGEDTRHGFTGYLKKALDDKGVRTFMDAKELKKGEEITPSLLKAIEDSMMAIIVLSENYASSSFCLQELSHILDTMKDKAGRYVLPVFYKVDPSDVRKLKRSYGEAMDKHDAASSSSHDVNNKWKASLQQVANLSGSHYKGDEYEYEFIEKIIEQVLRNIKPIVLPAGDCLVGLEHQKQHVTSLLNVGSNDTIHMVGIHGIGGIGKTTLALEVYNSIVHQFQCSCFFEKVRDFKESGLIYLQKILLSQIVGETNMEITSVRQGVSILQQRLHQKKVLLLLDDVDKDEQLKAIAGSSEWFGLGSRVIITTRDKRLLTYHGIERRYEVKGLNDADAFDLVGWKALKNYYNVRFSSYANVLKRAVAYASGLPLALEVIGSHFFNKTIEQCNHVLDRCERVPDKKIQTTLQVSFDALQDEDKFVFLDIACCLKGWNLTRVEEILHAHYGNIMKDHIDVLVEKSLIKISVSGNVTLHDLIEDMGKEIVRRESPEDPGKRTRLWAYEDIKKVFKENTGTSTIKIIHFQFDPWIEKKKDASDGKAFKKMKNLRTLIFSTPVCFSETSEHIPNSLRVLEYSNRNRNYYHSRGSNLFEWDGFLKKKFENMKVLNYDCDTLLTRMPDISNLPNLEQFSIQDCTSLITIDESVGFLSKLKILRLIGCNNLQSVPPLNSASLVELNLSHCHSLESFPPVVSGFLGELKILRVIGSSKIRLIPSLVLPSLEELDLLDCTSLDSFSHMVFGDKLKTMSFRGCYELRSIPPLKLDSLEKLYLSYCPNLVSISPLKLDSLEKLVLSNCYKLESFPSVVDGFLGKLKTLFVRNCHNLRSIPTLKLDSLEKLDLSHCRNLVSISPLKLDSLETLGLSNCYKLESFPSVVDGFLGKLKTLFVRNCHNLRSIPTLRLDSLEKLDLSHCRNLVNILPLKLDSLEKLYLSSCYKLESFPNVVDGFLGKLKTLFVKSCHNLRSIPALKLDSLEKLYLSYCRNLVSISPLKLDSLEKLVISNCYKLESFPGVVDGLLDKLKTLFVKNCHNLRSIPALKLDSLEKLDLSHCHNLVSIPSLKLDSLETLNLSDCYKLESFPSVVDGLLDKLKFLNIENCIMLRNIPRLSLTSLEQFNLSCCYRLESFPEILGEMRNIPRLHLDETPIKELPFPFQNLTQPQTYYPCNCGHSCFPNRASLMSKMAELSIQAEEKMSPIQSSHVKYICVKKCKLSDEYLSKTLMLFANVKELHLTNSKFTVIPKSIEKCNFLWKLVLDDCKELEEIKGIPPCLRELSAVNCKLTSSCKSNLLNQKLHEAGNTRFCLPRAKIPEWFDHQCEAGMSVSFWFCNKFPSIALGVVSAYTWGYLEHPARVIINDNTFFYTHGRKIDRCSRPDTYHLHLFHMQVEYFNGNMDKALLENKWNHAEVDFGFPFMFSGIHVLKEKSNMKDIRFTNPENDANIVLHSGF